MLAESWQRLALGALQRNLLYTAVTGGKKLVVLVGTKKAPGIAVRRQGTGRRYTDLRRKLVEGADR